LIKILKPVLLLRSSWKIPGLLRLERKVYPPFYFLSSFLSFFSFFFDGKHEGNETMGTSNAISHRKIELEQIVFMKEVPLRRRYRQNPPMRNPG